MKNKTEVVSMAKMKVHELAKELEKQSKEIIGTKFRKEKAF